MSNAPSTADREYDPVFLHARREALAILAAFVLAMVWAITWCIVDGYYAPGEPVGEIPLILGIPRWTFWGILVPWLVADAFSVWFCFFYFVEDNLGAAHEGLDIQEEIAELDQQKRATEHRDA